MNAKKISQFILVAAFVFIIWPAHSRAYYYEQPVANQTIYTSQGTGYWELKDIVSTEYPTGIVDTPIWLGFFIMSTSTNPSYLNQNDTQVGLECWTNSYGGTWVQQQTATLNLGAATGNGDGTFHWIATTTGNALNGWSICDPPHGIRISFYKLFEGASRWNGTHIAFIVSADEIITDTSSRIDTFSYSTTTAKATITGFWNATTTPYISERLTFWQYSDTLGEESRQYFTATTTGAFSWTFDFRDPYAWTSGESSTTPIYTSFSLNASLDQYDETNYVFPYGGTIIDNLDATSTTLYAASYNASDFISTPRDLALYPEYECGITSMMGCIKNALIWTFYPTQDALDSWTNLKTTLETKAPIGYFYSVKNSIGGLSATSTPSFSLTIPAHLKQYIFDPFDIGIAGILWFFFIFHFYKRLKHIQI